MVDLTGLNMPQYDVEGNTSAPSWMGTGAYSKWWQGSDPDYDANDPAVKQQWWRSPSVGGGLVYHPYWGWQDRSAVKNLYKSDNNNDVTWDEFSNWGLTKQTDQDWKKYYPNAVTDAELAAGGGGNTDPMTIGGNGTTGGDAVATSNYDTSGLGAFTNYPSQLGQSQNLLNTLAGGNPWQTDEASNIAYGLANGVDSWYNSAKSKGWYDTTDAIKQAAEQAGMGGTRYSSMMGRSAQDIAGRNAANLATSYAQQMQDARLQSAGLLQGLGNDETSRLGTTSDRLAALGQQVFDMPQTLAKNSYGMGQQNQTTAQTALDKYYQEFLRNADENNPYLNMIYSMATGQGTPTQYTAGTGTSLANILASLLGR